MKQESAAASDDSANNPSNASKNGADSDTTKIISKPQVTKPSQYPEPLKSSGDISPAPFIDFHKYKIIEEIGRGGMAVVYKVHDVILNRMAALKVLPLHYSNDKALIDRFYREAMSAARLSHPNIITIYEVGEAAGSHYIAMELIEGKGLDKIISSQRLPEDQILDIGIEISSALSYAHSEGIIHRDIKPANIMLRGNGHIVIMDFGLAKPQDAVRLTATGSFIGTPLYMSPEQARMERSIDHRTDIYSAGVVLYELLSGRTPFDGDTMMGITKKITTAKVPSINILTKGRVSKRLEAIVNKCLEKDPSYRYESADAIKSDLEAYRNGEAIKAKPPTVIERFNRFGKRYKTPAYLTVSMLGLIWAFHLYYGNKVKMAKQVRSLDAAINVKAMRDKEMRETKDYESSVLESGKIYEEKGDYNSALKVYEDIYSRYKDVPDMASQALYKKGELDYRLGSYDRAIEDFSGIMKMNIPSLRDICLYYLGLSYLEKGELDKSVKIVSEMTERSVRHDLSPEVALEFLDIKVAESFRKKVDYEKAIEYYNKAVELVKAKDASSQKIYILEVAMCNILEEWGKTDEALSVYKELYMKKQNPLWELAGLYAASIHILKGESAPAKGYLKEIASCSGKASKIEIIIAGFMSDDTRKWDADTFEKFLSSVPTRQQNDILYFAGLNMESRGSRTEAINYLDRCLKVTEKDTEEWPYRIAERLLQKIKQGDKSL